MAIDRSRYSREGREAQGQGGGGRDDDTELITLAEGELFEGVFERTMEPRGKMKSPMHFFTRASDEAPVKMWGYTVLDDKITEANRGDFVELTYHGMVEPEGGGNAYHSCTLEIFPPAGGSGGRAASGGGGGRSQGGGGRDDRGGGRSQAGRDERGAAPRDDRRGGGDRQRGRPAPAPAPDRRGGGGSPDPDPGNSDRYDDDIPFAHRPPTDYFIP